MKEPAKIEKVTDDALSRSIFSSVIGIIICMVCLVGTTWAWYSSSVTSGVSVTEGANFDFSVEITENVAETDGVYTFGGGEHTVKLTKTGTAEKGFCKVEAKKSGEEAEATPSYYIVDFTGEESVSFTVKGSGTLKLIPMWGTPASDYTEIANNEIVLTLLTLKALLPVEADALQEETTSEEELEPEPDPEEEIGGSTEQQTEQEQQTPANEEMEEPDETPEKETAEEQTESPEEEPPEETTEE